MKSTTLLTLLGASALGSALVRPAQPEIVARGLPKGLMPAAGLDRRQEPIDQPIETPTDTPVVTTAEDSTTAAEEPTETPTDVISIPEETPSSAPPPPPSSTETLPPPETTTAVEPPPETPTDVSTPSVEPPPPETTTEVDEPVTTTDDAVTPPSTPETTTDDLPPPTTTDDLPPPTTTDAGATTTTEAGDGPTSTPFTTATNTDLPPLTSTETVPPAGFAPTTVSNHPEWTTNTWITTTSEGSSDPTIVPVLVGCDDCGGDGSGIVIFGFPPVTGTQFSFPGFPGFSFPCIPPGCSTPPTTGGEDGNNDDNHSTDSDDQTTDGPSSTTEGPTSTTATCTEEITASDCLVSCTTYTGPADAEITPECSTTCTATHTGCSATGVTTTTGAEACSATGAESCTSCSPLTLDEEAGGEDDGDGESLKKRAVDSEQNLMNLVIKRFSNPGKHSLNKRFSGPQTETKLGSCTLTKSVAFPGYPSGPDIANAEGSSPNPYADVPRWFAATQDPSTCAPQLKVVDQAEYDTIYPKGSNGFPVDPIGRQTNDHVYEKKWLTEFFSIIVNDGAASVQGKDSGDPQDQIPCDDLNYYTGDSDFLGDVFNSYPGGPDPDHLQYMDDFIGMSHYVNDQCKGAITKPDTLKSRGAKLVKVKGFNQFSKWAQIDRTVKAALEFVEKLIMGVEVLNKDEISSALQRQNNRIYKAFQNLDNYAKNCKSDKAVNAGVWSFAERYKAFISSRFDGTEAYSLNPIFNQVGSDVVGWLDTNMAAVNKDNLNDAEKEQFSKYETRYSNIKSASYDVSVSWDWTTKRQDDGDDEGEGASCPLPTNSNTNTNTATTFTTSIRTNTNTGGDDQTTGTPDETLPPTGGPTTPTDEPTTTPVTTDEPITTTPVTTEEPPTTTTAEEPETTTTPIDTPSTSEAPETTTEQPPTTTEAPPTTTEAPPPVTTTSEAPPPVSTTPLRRLGRVCHNEADFPGHADIQSGAQSDFATKFSGIENGDGETDLFEGVKPFKLFGTDKHGVKYQYVASWVSGCVTEKDRQSFKYPVGMAGQETAYLFVREAYTECNNGGVGGKEQVGCILYEFTGGLGKFDES